MPRSTGWSTSSGRATRAWRRAWRAGSETAPCSSRARDTSGATAGCPCTWRARCPRPRSRAWRSSRSRRPTPSPATTESGSGATRCRSTTCGSRRRSTTPTRAKSSRRRWRRRHPANDRGQAHLRPAERIGGHARAHHAPLAARHPQEPGRRVAQGAGPRPAAAARVPRRQGRLGRLHAALSRRARAARGAGTARAGAWRRPRGHGHALLRLPRREPLSPIAAARLSARLTRVTPERTRGRAHDSSPGAHGRCEMTKAGAKKMRAYVLIETAPGKTKAVKKELAAIEGSDSTVANLDAVTGPFDFIAVVEGPTLDAVGRLVTDEIGSIDGVTRTTTCLAVAIG